MFVIKLQGRKLMELYIHIPFCVKKCAYCDFLSFPVSQFENQTDEAETGESSTVKDCCFAGNYCNKPYMPEGRNAVDVYIDALCNELQRISGLSYGKFIKTCFIGGGTPSIIEPNLMEKLLKTIKRCFAFTGDYEFSIECNPGTLTMEKLLLYRKYGINRLSIGLQSDKNECLKTLGRIHTYGRFLESFVMARRAGFNNINIDLMSAIPGLTGEEWRHTLHRVCMLEPEHISAYSLIIEPGTPFYERYNSTQASIDLPDEDTERGMYYDTKEILDSYGYSRYEISNYARKGYVCRHNYGYWTGEHYIGAGLGSSSYLSADEFGEYSGNTPDENNKYETVRFKNSDSLAEYIDAYGNKGGFTAQNACVRPSVTDIEYLSREDMMSEFCILGLRTTDGISKDEYLQRFAEDIEGKFGTVINKYRSLGLIEEKDNRIFLSLKGIDVSNTIMSEFL